MRRGGGAGGGGNGVSIADDGVEEMRQSNGISDYQRQGDASQTANGGAPDEANVSAYPPIGDEEEPGVDRYARPVSKLNFYAGCFLAFLSGFLTMFNNFLIKETGSDFGELIAIRSLLQIAAMLALSKVMGLAVIPRSHLDKVLLLIMGLFGGLTMISAYSCIRFMPVADAMTLVFTNPLFTLIFELLFFGTKLSVIKGLGGACLMAGIVLVMKPPFLFPSPEPPYLTGLPRNISEKTLEAMGQGRNLSKMNYFLASLSSQSAELPPTPIHPSHDLYFVGAVIALACAIFAGGNSILQAKMGHIKPVVQLFYVGIGALVCSLFAPFIDDTDRFYSGKIVLITWQQWLIYIGLACSGMASYASLISALYLRVPPTTVAALRTLQIVLAFIAQVAIFGYFPGALDVSGAVIVVGSALALTFERKINSGTSKLWRSCSNRMLRSSREEEDRLIDNT